MLSVTNSAQEMSAENPSSGRIYDIATPSPLLNVTSPSCFSTEFVFIFQRMPQYPVQTQPPVRWGGVARGSNKLPTFSEGVQ